MSEGVTSFRADEIVKRAEECYALGLIRESTLEKVTRKAMTDPEYDPILDLPLTHVIEHEKQLRLKAQGKKVSWLWRMLTR